KYIKESSVESLRITDSTIKFLDRQGDQVPINLASEINDNLLETRMPLFIKDLHRIGDPAKELCKVEGTSLEPTDRLSLYSDSTLSLGERLAMYNWDEEVKKEMKDRFTYRSYKNALRITQMNIRNFNVLLEEARLGSQKGIEQLLALD
ncbi:17697_t:CDS:2, partial [Racocetra persica]